ncbi:MAG: N-acetylmuramoyl-L-alanine amidase [Halobacteriovoraceae bacterium]|nr:N-acetylmuramoyl-L-alanine amidase [Halobacteriovoraceae bacterium]
MIILKKITILFLFYLLCGQTILAQTILIDPGHGGEDKGAKSQPIGVKKYHIYEKELSLQISKRIYKKLSKKYKVFLTRSVDRSVSLQERANIAEKIKADIFISVHINASPTGKSRGFETYYLDNHKNKAIKKVEAIENRNLKGEAFMVHRILTDLVIERTTSTSKKLASSIHGRIAREISKSYGITNRGIKPGLFYVLALTKRPAVLLEAGFITNKKEIKKMRSKNYQERFAKAVAIGVDNYFKKLKRESGNKKQPVLF